MMDCNLKSMYILTRELAPHMKENKYGVIINMSSIFHKGEYGQCLYSTCKSAVLGFTNSLAKELGQYNIRVHAVAPGYTRTAMTQRWIDKGVEPDIIGNDAIKKSRNARRHCKLSKFFMFRRIRFYDRTYNLH